MHHKDPVCVVMALQDLQRMQHPALAAVAQLQYALEVMKTLEVIAPAPHLNALCTLQVQSYRFCSSTGTRISTAQQSRRKSRITAISPQANVIRFLGSSRSESTNRRTRLKAAQSLLTPLCGACRVTRPS